MSMRKEKLSNYASTNCSLIDFVAKRKEGVLKIREICEVLICLSSAPQCRCRRRRDCTWTDPRRFRFPPRRCCCCCCCWKRNDPFVLLWNFCGCPRVASGASPSHSMNLPSDANLFHSTSLPCGVNLSRSMMNATFDHAKTFSAVFVCCGRTKTMMSCCRWSAT